MSETVYIKHKPDSNEHYYLTIFDETGIKTVNLSKFDKEEISFGRSTQNDIIIDAEYIDEVQGYLKITEYGLLAVNTSKSIPMSGNNKFVTELYLAERGYLKFFDPNANMAKGVIIIMQIRKELDEWKQMPLKVGKISIGSNSFNDILFPIDDVKETFAEIVCSKDEIKIRDICSTNGTYVNGKKVLDTQELKNLDVIFIGNQKVILYQNTLVYQIFQMGLKIDAVDVVKEVRTKKGYKCIADHINLTIKPSEFVAFVGGSGAGKTTFMKCISGIDKPTSGKILLNGQDLYENYETLKENIGYVPQEDIVYSNLRLYDMLKYTAQLRMADSISEKERRKRIEEVLEIVQLSDFKYTYIKQLSGGQRKRASIAVELIADPSLFFLDEPTSGLDPGTEKSIMETLKNMSSLGKTIILVTHNILNIGLCDKVVFFGTGGRLCFSGTPKEALAFFGVKHFVDIYDLLNNQANEYADKFKMLQEEVTEKKPTKEEKKPQMLTHKKSFLKQLWILIKRYIKLIANDTQQLLLLFAQAPVIAVLLSFVANDKMYSHYSDTKGMLFSIGCACVWLGLLNSIQEICKERVILEKEHMANLKLSTYLLSKFIVQAILAFIQSSLIVMIFQGIVGKSDYSILINNYWDIQIVCFLSILSSASMGLFVSSFVKNSDIAMSVIPLILVPQLLFSGILFKLEGLTEAISYFILCRYSVEGLGTSVNLNELTHPEQLINPQITVEPEKYFTFTEEHMIHVILAMVVMTFVLILASYFMLKKRSNKNL